MNNSILLTIKKLLGIPEDVTAFDTDIIVAINTAMSSASQLGFGDFKVSYSISGSSETWSDYIGEETNLEMLKTYIYLKTRLLFDPPQSSAVMEAFKNSIGELEFRIQSVTDF